MDIPIQYSKLISVLTETYDALETSDRQDELFKTAVMITGVAKSEKDADVLLFVVKEAKKPVKSPNSEEYERLAKLQRDREKSGFGM